MLVSHKGRALPIDALDRLWLARAVEAEGEPRGQVAQVLVNRWAWLLDRGIRSYPRLQDLIQAYSQPVNPRWMPGGDLLAGQLAQLDAQAEKAAAELPEAERPRVYAALKQARAAALAAAERRRKVHAARKTFSPRTTAAVELALKGPIVIPIGAVDFGPPKGGAWTARTLRPGDEHTNALYSAPGSEGVSYAFDDGGPDFQPFPMSRALATSSPVAGLVVAGMGLIFAWSVGRKRRR